MAHLSRKIPPVLMVSVNVLLQRIAGCLAQKSQTKSAHARNLEGNLN